MKGKVQDKRNKLPFSTLALSIKPYPILKSKEL